MKIKEIDERIKSNYTKSKLDNFSSFVLSEYLSDGTVTEVIPLKNKSEDISFDGRDTIITDLEGNLLVDKKEHIFDTKRIVFVDGNKVVIESGKERWTTLGGTHNDITDVSVYEYVDGKFVKVETLFYERADNNIDIKVVNKDKGLLMINKVNRNDKKGAFLYSVPNKQVISPIFNSIEKVEDTNKDIYRYSDVIVSNKTLDDEHKTSHIIGYINGDGIILDEIYDENRNAVRDIEMHNETKYHDYDCLKENLASELDKRIDDERTIKGIKDKSIKILELDAKIKY